MKAQPFGGGSTMPCGMVSGKTVKATRVTIEGVNVLFSAATFVVMAITAIAATIQLRTCARATS